MACRSCQSRMFHVEHSYAPHSKRSVFESLARTGKPVGFLGLSDWTARERIRLPTYLPTECSTWNIHARVGKNQARISEKISTYGTCDLCAGNRDFRASTTSPQSRAILHTEPPCSAASSPLTFILHGNFHGHCGRCKEYTGSAAKVGRRSPSSQCQP